MSPRRKDARVYRWNSGEYDADELSEESVDFRLIYEGRLSASTPNDGRVKNKHEVRKAIHKQLASLYKQHHALRSRPIAGSKPWLDAIADTYARCGFRFVPLVNESQALVCGLDILFLRRDEPGHILKSGGGGDIDRRIVTLLDGLRVPDNCNELPADATPDADEDPMFCLLQNDALVTELRIETDRLLTPMKPKTEGDNEDEVSNHPENDVVLIVQVNVRTTRVAWGNIDFLA